MSTLKQQMNFLKALGMDPSKLTLEQLDELSSVEKPEDLKPEEILELFQKLGIDISKFFNNINQHNLLKKKERRNAICPCGSEKKYKKCCGAVKQ